MPARGIARTRSLGLDWLHLSSLRIGTSDHLSRRDAASTADDLSPARLADHEPGFDLSHDPTLGVAHQVPGAEHDLDGRLLGAGFTDLAGSDLVALCLAHDQSLGPHCSAVSAAAAAVALH